MEPKSSKISVLIASYNHESFIEEAILSAVTQDYPHLEVVVVDDASRDRTPDIISRLAHEFPGRIVPVLGDVNVGVTANVNRGLLRCTGDFIAFQGGDDVLLPGKIRRQVSFMQSNPSCSVSYHDVEVFDSRTGETFAMFSDKNPMLSGDARMMFVRGCFCCATSVMIRRPASGLMFDERIVNTSDWMFWIEVLMDGRGTVLPMAGVLARYRRHERNVTSTARDQNVRGLLRSIDLLVEKYPELRSDAGRARCRVHADAAWSCLRSGRSRREGLSHAAKAIIASPREGLGLLRMFVGRYTTRSRRGLSVAHHPHE